MLKLGASIVMLFKQVPLLERFALARAAGFDGVEIQWPYATDPQQLKAAADAAGVEIVLINSPVGSAPAGTAQNEPMITAVPGLQQRFRKAATTALNYAMVLECATVNVLPGQRVETFTRVEQIETYQENLAFAAELFAAQGVTVVAEPVNPIDRPGMLVNTVAEMLEIIDAVGSDNLKVQLDAYHAAMAGEDAVAILHDHLPRIGHIQFADIPGRGAPGSADFDFDRLFAAIAKSRYSGWTCAEYVPGDTDENFEWLTRLKVTAG